MIATVSELIEALHKLGAPDASVLIAEHGWAIVAVQAIELDPEGNVLIVPKLEAWQNRR